MKIGDRRALVQDLVTEAENAQLHHPSRDSDWLRPEVLRRVLRLIVHILEGEYDDPTA